MKTSRPSSLSAGMTPPSPECVDAELVAAWAERTLPPAQMAAVESHLADCSRCQAVLAAFAESEPASVKANGAWWRQRVRWLVPAAAAAAILLWAVVPRESTPPSANRTLARVERNDAPVPPAPAAVPSSPVDTPRPLAPSTKSGEAAPRQNTPARSPRSAEAAPLATEVTPASPPATPSGAAVSTADRAAESSRSTAVAQAPTPPAADSQASLQPAVGRLTRSSSATIRIINIDIAPPSADRDMGIGAGRAEGAMAPARWRIIDNARVERSVNGGAWQPVAIDGPVVLTAGAATSSSVCWVVGPAGVVLRSIDGTRFERRSLPEATDISSIRAIDARQATITTAAGRVFVTTDGGLTWTRMP